MAEKTKATDASSQMIRLSANQIIDLIVERHLAQMGWNPETKAFDRKGIICRPLVLVGPAGIGKSELPAQAAKRLSEIVGDEIRTRDCNLQYLESPDLAGLAENLNVEGERVTVHGRPGLLPKNGRGIWFLDEPNRVNRDIRSAMLTLIQARRVNDYQLGKDWMIVMAMNPAEHAGVTYEVGEWDRALRDRVTFIWFEPSVEELLAYLRGIYGDHLVIRWIESAGLNAATNHLLAFKGEEGRITPRALEFLIRAIEAAGGFGTENWFRAAKAEVGKDLAVLLSTFVQAVRTVTAEEVVDSFEKPTIEKLAALESEGRHDVLSNLNSSIAALLHKRFGEDAMPIDSKEAQAMIGRIARYLEVIPADAKNSFFIVTGEKLQTLPNKALYPAFVAVIMKGSPALQRHFKIVKDAQRAAEKSARG